MFHYKSEQFARLLIILDTVAAALVYLLILGWHESAADGDPLDYRAHIGLLLVILVAFGLTRLNDLNKVESTAIRFLPNAGTIVKSMAFAMAVTIAFVFLLKLQFASRFVLAGFAISATVLLLAIRAYLSWWYDPRRRNIEENYLKILLIGSGQRAYRLAKKLDEASAWGIKVIGFLDPKGESHGRRKGDRILGRVDEISEVLRNNVIDEVIIAVPRSLLGDLQSIIDACEEEGVRLRFMANLYDFGVARISLTLVDDIPLLNFEPVSQSNANLIVKRLFDLCLVLAAMPFFLAMFLIIGLAIRLDSPGSAVFAQERVGLRKRLFKMYKFRSMVVDAEQKMKEIEHLNEASGPNFKIENDPRITRVGRFLRRTSIDELPQLFNVLNGDMSLVGPRPMSIRDVSLFDRGIQRKRFSVRPGITCIWQISGRSSLSFEQWLELDLKYIDEWSLWLDFKILLKTIPSVLKGSGAV